jgi:hypothetical protein
LLFRLSHVIAGLSKKKVNISERGNFSGQLRNRFRTVLLYYHKSTTMENEQNGKSENEENHYTSTSTTSEERDVQPLKDDGLGETLDQGEEDDDSQGLAGNAAGNTDAEDQ